MSTAGAAPARPGPAMVAADTVVCSFELPSTSLSRSTSDGRYDVYATSKKTVKIPTTWPHCDTLRHKTLLPTPPDACSGQPKPDDLTYYATQPRLRQYDDLRGRSFLLTLLERRLAVSNARTLASLEGDPHVWRLTANERASLSLRNRDTAGVGLVVGGSAGLFD